MTRSATHTRFENDLAHTILMDALLTTAGVTGDQHDTLYQAWMRAVCTQQLYLSHAGRFDRLTGDEITEVVEACRFALADCQEAARSLDSGDGTGPTDWWLGSAAPSFAFERFAAWFADALAQLRGAVPGLAVGDPYEARVEPMSEMP